MLGLARSAGGPAAAHFRRRPLSAERLEVRTLMAGDFLSGGWADDALTVVDESPQLTTESAGQRYSAIVFVGGWGSSMYQYAYSDPMIDRPEDDLRSADPHDVDLVLTEELAADEQASAAAASDDVIVDGRIITGENFDSAADSTFDDLDSEMEDPSDVASHGYIRVKKLNTGG